MQTQHSEEYTYIMCEYCFEFIAEEHAQELQGTSYYCECATGLEESHVQV